MKYAVGAGHTKKGIGTGAVGKINESIETRVVAPLVVNYLRLVGEEAELLVVDEITKPLDDCRWRADRANELKADRYVEIHFNAGGGRGSEVYAVSNAGKVMAQGVVNSICALGFANRGVKSNDYIVLTRTDMPAILIECCFVDSDEDAKLYNADKI
jgi:N-acetylmuramoyl-L-alanine amidase